MRITGIATLILTVSAWTNATWATPAAADPDQLVGVWEVVKGPPGTPAGSTLTFKADGQFDSKIKGTNNIFSGQFRVEGNSLMLEPPGFPATIRVVDANNIVIVGITGPAEYRRQGAGGGNRAATPRAARKSTTTNFNLGGGGFTVGSKASGGIDRSGGVPGGPSGTGQIPFGPGTSDGGTVTSIAGGWKLVASKPYQFRVEMPRQPNGEEGGQNEGFETHVLTCQLANMELLIMAVEGPAEIPKGEEDKVCERLRSEAVSRSGGTAKVLSQGPLLLRDLEGREYQMTIEKSPGNALPAQARVFLHGKLGYVVLAAARGKSQALPPDAQRFLDSFALGAGEAEPAKGAAEPEKSMAEARPRSRMAEAKARTSARTSAQAWGDEVDPDGDVAIRPDGRKLTMKIPGTPHILAPERDKMNAPRVVAPVEGDFVATVRVDGTFQPSDKSTLKGLSSRQAGGLILWKDSKNYLVFQRRAASGDEGKDTNQAVLEELVAGDKGASRRPAAPPGSLFLRLERTRGRIAAAYSVDGKGWMDVKPVDTSWAVGELQVGVVAVSTSTGPHTVTFGDYSVKPK